MACQQMKHQLEVSRAVVTRACRIRRRLAGSCAIDWARFAPDRTALATNAAISNATDGLTFVLPFSG